jgi:hypothetical protein
MYLYICPIINKQKQIMKQITLKITGILNNQKYETYVTGINIVDALKSLPKQLRIQIIE